MGIVPSGRVGRRLAAQYTSRDLTAMRWCRAIHLAHSAHRMDFREADPLREWTLTT